VNSDSSSDKFFGGVNLFIKSFYIKD